MLEIERKPNFLKKISKLKDSLMKEKVKKQIKKILQNPEIGKPMQHERKGTRELYVKPFRLSYAFLKDENKVIFLDLYHKKRQ